MLESLTQRFDAEFLPSHDTRLLGGFPEPVYLPAENGKPAEIRFTRDYIRSALHEVAHWCVAGAERRKLQDFGYWYRPDGRNAVEQKEFFGLEIKPQALELAFSEALGIPFEVSCDNLTGDAGNAAEVEKFEQAVRTQLAHYRTNSSGS